MFIRALRAYGAYVGAAFACTAVAPAACSAVRVERAPTVRECSKWGGWEVGYVTDVEGNWDYFRRYVRLSRVVRFTDSSETQLELVPNKMFVYGGDVFDRGVGDMRIARMLIALKEKHPRRVVLLLGNRDVNKMRLTSELDDAELARPLEDIEGPFWVSKKRRVTPAMHVERRIDALYGQRLRRQWSSETKATVTQEMNTSVERLKYMLRHTMGCPLTFEYRRQELAAEAGHGDPTQVSDQAVLRSFMDSALSPQGVVRRYMELGQLGAVVGNTIFVHGCLTSLNKGFLPAPSNVEAVRSVVPGTYTAGALRVQEWVSALNAWAHESVLQWIRHPRFEAASPGAPVRFRGGHALRAYCYRPVMQGHSVVVQTLFTDDSRRSNLDHPRPVPNDVIEYLNADGVGRLVVGHKPFGSTPTVMQHRGLEVVSCDTSYSDYSARDTRGRAVAELCVQGTPTSNRAFIHGVLPSGEAYAFALPTRRGGKGDVWGGSSHTTAEEDKLVGLCTAAGFIVTARLSDGNYLLRKGTPGYHVLDRVVPSSDPELQSLQFHERH